MAFIKEVTTCWPARQFIEVIYAAKRNWFKCVRTSLFFSKGRSLTFWADRERIVSLLDSGCVQPQQSVQPSRDSEGKHSRQHLNVCPAVAVTCHPPTKLFFVSPLNGLRNGKLPTLVSETDKHWLSNCAKIARLVNASSLVVTHMLLCVSVSGYIFSVLPKPLVAGCILLTRVWLAGSCSFM